MARGGKRSGTPGVAYGNRSDLNAQPVRAATGQPYGVAGAQQAAQQAVPLPTQTPIPISAPTNRPTEHVMSGAPIGPGPGPVAAGITPAASGDPVFEQLQAIYAAHPNDDLGQLLASIKGGDYNMGGMYGQALH